MHRAAQVKGSQGKVRLRFPRDFGLTLAMLGIFLVLAVGQTLVGRRALNDDLKQHHQPQVTYGRYLQTGLCWESLSENWESEFLEMGAFVWLTSFLYQRGSPESHEPGESQDVDEHPVQRNSPWPARRGGWVAAVYARSLSLAFAGLFLVSMAIHAVAGASEYNRQQREHGDEAVSALGFMGTSEFWFQSLQNWQSEFLGIGSMVVLSIFLRQKGSPESKAVNSPWWEHE